MTTAPSQESSIPEHIGFPEITDQKKRAYLAAFAATGNHLRAAAAAGITDRTHRNWLKADEQYAEVFEDAKQMAADHLEEEAWRRAKDGLIRFKFQRNGKPLVHPVTKQPYYEHEYSDVLLIFLLKGLRPEKYRERFEHAGPGGGPLEVTFGGRYKPDGTKQAAATQGGGA